MKHFACAIGLIVGLSAAAAVAQTDEPGLPSGPGKDLTGAKCSTCHGMGRVLIYKRTRAQWASTVELMKEKGLEASDAEVKAIVDYLAMALPPPPEDVVALTSGQAP